MDAVLRIAALVVLGGIAWALTIYGATLLIGPSVVLSLVSLFGGMIVGSALYLVGLWRFA